MDNVLECYATSGGKDYILSVVARDIDDYYDINIYIIAKIETIVIDTTI